MIDSRGLQTKEFDWQFDYLIEQVCSDLPKPLKFSEIVSDSLENSSAILVDRLGFSEKDLEKLKVLKSGNRLIFTSSAAIESVRSHLGPEHKVSLLSWPWEPVQKESANISTSSSKPVIYFTDGTERFRTTAVLSALSKVKVPVVFACLGNTEHLEHRLKASDIDVMNLSRVSSTEDLSDILTGEYSCSINTYFGGAGDPGLSLASSLVQGIPVVVSQFGVGELLPTEVCRKASLGLREAEEVFEAIRFFQNSTNFEVFSERAREFSLEHYNLEGFRKEYRLLSLS